mmetsp:Transcript_9074/g.14765  ORF Transcript_9074/g.14765 Transcript_9074/m.14765 type:complete len:157 (-) Transcript_9074:3410-3880(-)
MRIKLFGGKDTCRFCEIANVVGAVCAPRKLLFEDDEFVAFETKDPRAKFHQLVVPRVHVDQKCVSRIEHTRFGMLTRMVDIGESLLDELPERERCGSRLVFHRPPFNSVNHLHLHVMAPPFNNWYRDIAHLGSTPWAIDARRLVEEKRYCTIKLHC